MAVQLVVGQSLFGADSPSIDGIARNSTAPVVANILSEDEGGWSSVSDLAQDRRGFVWIATQAGVYRFDGVAFRALPDSRLDLLATTVYAAVDGSIWIGNYVGQVARVDPTSLVTTHLVEIDPLSESAPAPESEGARPPDVVDIAADGSGRIWVATDRGLYVGFRAEEPDFQRAVEGSFTFVESEGDHLWVGRSGGTLARLFPGVGSGPPTLSIHEVGECGAGILDILKVADTSWLVATQGEGVCRLEGGGEGWHTVRGWSLPGRRVRTLLADTQGGALVGSGSGLFVIGRDGQLLAHRSTEDGLPDNRISRLLRTRDGSLWAGTWNGLVALADKEGVVSLEDRVGSRMASDVVTITSTYDGTLVVGGMNGAPALLPEGAREFVQHQAATSSPVYSMLEDRHRSLWAASLGAGLFRWTHQGGFRRWSVGSGRLVSLEEDPEGGVWVGSAEEGLFRVTGDDTIEDSFAFDTGKRLGNGMIMSIAGAPDGSLWVPVFGVGLFRVSPTRDDMTAWDDRDALGGARVLSVSPQRDGSVWIATQGAGAFRLDPSTGQLDQYTEEDGLPSDNVMAVLPGNPGTMWLTTAEGLAALDLTLGRARALHRGSGIAGNRFYANSAHKDEETGLLYFGGPNGVTVVDPSKIQFRDTPPPVALTALVVDGDTVPVSRALGEGGLRLDHDENFFTFSFAALDFTDVSQNRYEYRLDPYEEEWNDNGNYNVANYTFVPSGNYTFRVRARNSEGVWNNEGLAIPVFVATPWYRTWWFYVLVFSAFAAATWALFAYRLSQLRQRQALRLNIAGKLHDDIGANLSAMALKAEMVRTADALDEKRRRQLSDLGRLARDTAHQVRETVWVVNTKYDTLQGLVAKMRDTADVLLNGHFDVVFTAPESLPARRVPMELRQDVYLLFKESLQNIVKHSGAETVQVEVAYDAPHLTVTVRDDGKGFRLDDLKEGNGLDLMRQRAARRQGSVAFDTRIGEGTTVRLRVPIG